MRVATGDATVRHSVCYATYGYMGDLLRASETMRWSRWVLPSCVTLGRTHACRPCA